MKKLYSLLIALSGLNLFAATNTVSNIVFDSPSNRVVRAGWVNVDDSHHLKGRKLEPEFLNDRIVIVHRWCMDCPGINSSLGDFDKLKVQGDDIVKVTSYYPGAPHARDMVIRYLKSNHVNSSVYTGAAPDDSELVRRHRATYVVAPGGEILWSVTQNTCIKELQAEINKSMEAWRLKAIEYLSESRPGLAYLRAKEFKKLHSKSSSAVKPVMDKLDNPKIRALADLEGALLKHLAKPDPKKVKSLQDRFEAFRKNCPEEYHHEIDRMIEDSAM